MPRWKHGFTEISVSQLASTGIQLHPENQHHPLCCRNGIPQPGATVEAAHEKRSTKTPTTFLSR
jgi:hypothetical protein